MAGEEMSRKRSAPSGSKGDSNDSKSNKKLKVNESPLKGYVVQFNWDDHYYSTRGKPSDSSLAVAKSALVPSIPLLFLEILKVIQPMEYDTKKYDIVHLLDKRIIREGATRDKEALAIKDSKGAVYQVNACRKEHVKLVYSEILEQRGLCPCLMDIHYVGPEKNMLVGGGATVKCTCAVKAPSAAVAAASTAAQSKTKVEEDKSETVAEEAPVKDVASEPVDATAMDVEEDEEDAVMDPKHAAREESARRKKIIDSIDKEGRKLNAPVWEAVQAAIIEAKESSALKYRELVEAQFTQIDALTKRAEDAEALAEEMSERYKEEKNFNEQLQTRLNGVKTRIMNMSKK